MNERWQRAWRLTAVAFDAWALAFAIGGAALIRFGLSGLGLGFAVGATPVNAPWVVAIAIWMIAIGISGLYSPTRCASSVEEARRIATACLAAPGAFVMTSFILHGQPSRLWLGMSALLSIPFVAADRRLLRWTTSKLRTRGMWMSRAVIAGGKDAKALTDTLASDVVYGVQPVATCGFVWGELPSYDFADLRRAVLDSGARSVVVVTGSFSREEIQEELAAADELPVQIIVAPSLDYTLLHNVNLMPLGREPGLHLERPMLRFHQRVLKRSIDIVVSSAGLLVLSPVMCALAAAIRVDSSGPSLFAQRRVGRHGRQFDLFKFRTMIDGAEEQRPALVDDGLFKMKDDPRITRVGRFLRRSSLDELPQLWNVLRGEMSLVGPRPALPSEVATYHANARRRLAVRPGITGLWQVNGRSDLSFDEYVRLDLTYVQNWSVLLDAYVIARTAAAVVRSRGAY